MRKVSGIAVNNLIAMGPIRVIRKHGDTPEKRVISNSLEESNTLFAAVKQAGEQLDRLCEDTLSDKGKDVADVIEGQKLILEDKGFIDAICRYIQDENVCSSYATYIIGKAWSEKFRGMEDEYMRERAADILDVSWRIIKIVENEVETDYSGEKSIFVADELDPSELARINRDSILALVTATGSVNSHTAIMAKIMNVPALVGTNLSVELLTDGMEAAVDGEKGVFILEPDKRDREIIEDRISKQQSDRSKALDTYELPAETRSGRKIRIFANISLPEDADQVLIENAEGVGLFRSEFLYIARSSAPTEDEQFEAYRKIVEGFGDRPVIIRTLDIGGDKQVDYLNIPKEDNPAMGLRAIRLCFANTELFKVQLRALLRAACCGNLHIMYPMIISEEEIDRIKLLLNEAASELSDRGEDYRIPPQGIMIETPAAVFLSGRFAEKVDFFSIGTNDLSQYTLAIDRQNQSLEDYFDSHHPAILAMIRMVVDNAHAAGIWTGICGELASDVSLIDEFIEMGVDELSVAPAMIPEIISYVRSLE